MRVFLFLENDFLIFLIFTLTFIYLFPLIVCLVRFNSYNKRHFLTLY